MDEQFQDLTLAATLRATQLPMILTTDADGVPCYVKLDAHGTVVHADVAADRGDPEPDSDHEG